jgi:penicillin amidase
MHQVVPGKVNVTGVALPGQPFVICGHNERIAWGMTNVMLDDMDFYIEILNPSDTNQYKLDGAWRDMKISKEIIHERAEIQLSGLTGTHIAGRWFQDSEISMTG